MPIETHVFKRLVLGLQPTASGRSMRIAVELANLLHLDLLGLLLEDASLKSLANNPFAREFRPLGGGWRSIEADGMARDLELAARSIQRMFADLARPLATHYQFDIARGPTADTIGSISRTDDIVMIVEPMSPGERVTQQFERLIQAAFRSAAAVMLVPQRIARTKGPVVAIAASPDDPSIRTAATIAKAAREDLIILDICQAPIDTEVISSLAAELGLPVRHFTANAALRLKPPALLQNFQPFQERFVVATRGAFHNGEALMIAAARRAPVLVIEPAQMGRPEKPSETAAR